MVHTVLEHQQRFTESPAPAGTAGRQDVTLPAGVSLAVYDHENIVFASSGKWLHPLFDLEQFMIERSLTPGRLTLVDKIVGRAGALLIARLGFRSVSAVLMSELGRSALAARGITYRYATLVDRVDCATETILESVDDEGQAYEIVRQRAGR